MGGRQRGQWGHRDTAVSIMELGENAYLLQEPRDSGWDTAQAWDSQAGGNTKGVGVCLLRQQGEG